MLFLKKTIHQCANFSVITNSHRHSAKLLLIKCYHPRYAGQSGYPGEAFVCWLCAGVSADGRTAVSFGNETIPYQIFLNGNCRYRSGYCKSAKAKQ